MRKCEWHCVDRTCDKLAATSDIKDRAFCMEHTNWDEYGVGRLQLDAEILAHLLREEVTRDYGRGEAYVVDGWVTALERVAKRWNEGDL